MRFPALVLSALVCLSACSRPLALKALSAGIAAARVDNWEGAVRHWTKTLEADPGSVAAHNNLAIAFERQGAWDEARREYEAALRLDPANRTVKENYEAFRARLASGGEKKS